MNHLIEKLKSIPFSGNDMMECVGQKTKIVRYRDLHKYKNIEALLYPHNCFVLLYETKPQYGHWVCVILHDNNVIEFFDPYGYFIDDQLSFIDKKFRKKTNQNFPYISKLFLESPYFIEWNNKQLQKLYKNNSSCGRHVSLRINMRDMPLKEYQKILKTEGGLTPDDKVTYLTSFI